MPDWAGRIWFVTQDGRAGFVVPDTFRTAVLDLGDEIANSVAAGRDGGVYVVTVKALYKLGVGPSGKPAVTWRTTYDRGSEKKPGQLSQGSGTTPTILPGGLVAITDNADPRMHVQFYDVDDGALVCQAAVFGDGESASDNSLVSVGDGVVVENNYGYSGPLRTLFGRTTTGGLARVDVSGRTCTVAWTSDERAPSSVAKVSLANGLVYAYTKRKSWWGVNAWYVTAIDAATGRRVWAVRTGLGTLFNNHYSAITIAPDGSLYVATLAGMVRVRDRD
jgi:outer membrane protein assembly factor BamB